MAAALPVISWREAVRAFERAGFVQQRRRGSHIMLVKPGMSTLSVPAHDELKSGTLRKLIRLGGLTVDEFCSLL
jgi:predicted RNA binding protein YcfA (HicA-like mRNA interferase family)